MRDSGVVNGGHVGDYSYLPVRVGTIALIVSEIMLFGGLIAAFISIKDRFADWPPEGLPAYPALRTLVNTLFLLASGITVYLYRRTQWFLWGVITLILGLMFLILQGIEWVRLISYGLTFTSHIYGSIFYVIVGCHAIHVFVGFLWLFAAIMVHVKRRVWRGVQEGSTLFWYFVVLIWPVIYVIVYWDLI